MIIDEPEVHLHPRWQKVLLDILRDVCSEDDIQLIVSTHSPAFISEKTVNNVTRVAKATQASSRFYQTPGWPTDKAKELIHIVNTLNNERMFFADAVVLVEGIKDQILLGGLFDYLRKSEHSSVIEILSVGGKGNFSRFSKFLSEFHVPTFQVADQDYLKEVGNEEIISLFECNHRRVERSCFTDKKSEDRVSLLRLLEQALENGNLDEIRKFVQYAKDRHAKLPEVLNSEQEAELKSNINLLRKDNIYILEKGELEDYLPGYSSLERIIQLVDPEDMEAWLKNSENQECKCELMDIVKDIMNRV